MSRRIAGSQRWAGVMSSMAAVALCAASLVITTPVARAAAVEADVCLLDADSDAFDSDFGVLRRLAIETNNRLCRAMFVIEGQRFELGDTQAILVDFAVRAREAVDEAVGPRLFDKVKAQFDYFAASIDDLGPDNRRLRLDKLEAGMGNTITSTAVFFSANPGPRGEIPEALNEDCRKLPGSSRPTEYVDCTEAFQDLARAFNAYRHAYDQFRFERNESELRALGVQWDRYLEQGRAQTALDILFTTWMHRDHYASDRFVGPARTQYFLLRPQIVYEHINDAPRGSRDRVALAAEWIGINWWDWKVPFGISAISVYTDEANLDPAAHGLMFTFANRYSIGLTRRGDEDAIFVTLDFLQLAQDKRRQFEAYKRNFGLD